VALESLRLYPPVWSFARRALEERTLGGYRIPRGTIVVMSQWVVHRDPRNFADPEAFLPSRWSEGLLDRLPRFAYFPFGGGPRVCIGNSLAMSEIVLVLATVARRFRLEPVRDHDVRPAPGFNLVPRGGLPMIVRRR
jgi:cytochrome P450